MGFKIEKKVPVPPRAKRSCKYPWDSMEVGDSFVVGQDGPGKSAMASLCHIMGKKRFDGERKFICRQEAKGVRIWRTE